MFQIYIKSTIKTTKRCPWNLKKNLKKSFYTFANLHACSLKILKTKYIVYVFLEYLPHLLRIHSKTHSYWLMLSFFHES